MKKAISPVMVNEATDCAVEQSLIIYVKFVHNGKLWTHFFKLVPLNATQASDIYMCIVSTFDNLEIDMSKLSCITTDGASVMTGKVWSC